jgi:hypothetical protein
MCHRHVIRDYITNTHTIRSVWIYDAGKEANLQSSSRHTQQSQKNIQSLSVQQASLRMVRGFASIRFRLGSLILTRNIRSTHGLRLRQRVTQKIFALKHTVPTYPPSRLRRDLLKPIGTKGAELFSRTRKFTRISRANRQGKIRWTSLL